MWWWGGSHYELAHSYIKEKSRVNEITNKQVEVREHWFDILKDTSQCFIPIVWSLIMYCKYFVPLYITYDHKNKDGLDGLNLDQMLDSIIQFVENIIFF